jgi:hypothetical protein
MRNVFILFIIGLVSIACGGGGGGGGTAAATTTSDFNFKSSDAAATAGTWYASAFSINGTQQMPTTIRNIIITASSDGSWTMTFAIADSNGNVATSAATSVNSTDDRFKITAFDYVVSTSQNSLTMTETLVDSTDNSTWQVSATLIKKGTDTDVAGIYDAQLTSYTRNGVAIDLSATLTGYSITLSENGDAIGVTTAAGTLSETTTASIISIRDSIYVDAGTNNKSEIGGYTKVGSILSVNGTVYDGSTFSLNFTKR